jgi:hypothetical protein
MRRIQESIFYERVSSIVYSGYFPAPKLITGPFLETRKLRGNFHDRDIYFQTLIVRARRPKFIKYN